MKVRDNIPDDDLLVKISFRLRIGELIDSNLMQLLPLNFSKKIVKSLMGESDEAISCSYSSSATAQQPPPVQRVSNSQYKQPCNNNACNQPMQQVPSTANVSATDVCSNKLQPVYQQPMYQMPQQHNAPTCKCSTSSICKL